MPGLPQLIDEDVQSLDFAVDELLRKTEATAALIIDKGGPLISQRGRVDQFDTTTMAALAAGSFCATQAIAERMGETTFSNTYQQGEHHSLFVSNVDENVLLIVVFKASSSVGLVKYFSAGTIKEIASQLQRASLRDPDEKVDLVSMNVLDASDIFRKRSEAM